MKKLFSSRLSARCLGSVGDFALPIWPAAVGRRLRLSRGSNRGLTLVELVVASAIVSIIALAATALISASLSVHHRGSARADLYREGVQVMERVTEAVRRSTYVAIPNGRAPVRDLLAFSGFVNDDNDFYFDDPLFPRIDEDPGSDMNGDGQFGIAGVDDNNDGTVDGWTILGSGDDDEGTFPDEDPLDGIDNDDDGSIDEDVPADANKDGASGAIWMDDDGDGAVDDQNKDDDDEDGSVDEDGTNEYIIWIPQGTTLRQDDHLGGVDHVLSEHVTFFQSTLVTSQTILVEMTLTGDEGETVQFAEYVCPRNVLQKSGKRVQ